MVIVSGYCEMYLPKKIFIEDISAETIGTYAQTARMFFFIILLFLELFWF